MQLSNTQLIEVIRQNGLVTTAMLDECDELDKAIIDENDVALLQMPTDDHYNFFGRLLRSDSEHLPKAIAMRIMAGIPIPEISLEDDYQFDVFLSVNYEPIVAQLATPGVCGSDYIKQVFSCYDLLKSAIQIGDDMVSFEELDDCEMEGIKQCYSKLFNIIDDNAQVLQAHKDSLTSAVFDGFENVRGEGMVDPFKAHVLSSISKGLAAVMLNSLEVDAPSLSVSRSDAY